MDNKEKMDLVVDRLALEEDHKEMASKLEIMISILKPSLIFDLRAHSSGKFQMIFALVKFYSSSNKPKLMNNYQMQDAFLNYENAQAYSRKQ